MVAPLQNWRNANAPLLLSFLLFAFAYASPAHNGYPDATAGQLNACASRHSNWAASTWCISCLPATSPWDSLVEHVCASRSTGQTLSVAVAQMRARGAVSRDAAGGRLVSLAVVPLRFTAGTTASLLQARIECILLVRFVVRRRTIVQSPFGLDPHVASGRAGGFGELELEPELDKAQGHNGGATARIQKASTTSVTVDQRLLCAVAFCSFTVSCQSRAFACL